MDFKVNFDSCLVAAKGATTNPNPITLNFKLNKDNMNHEFKHVFGESCPDLTTEIVLHLFRHQMWRNHNGHSLLGLFRQNSGQQIAAVIQVGACHLAKLGEVQPNNGAGPRLVITQVIDELAGAR